MTQSSTSRGLRGRLLVLSAALTCPCHLPLVVALIAGVSLGAALRTYWPLFVAAAIYFVVALVWGMRLLREGDQGPRGASTCGRG